MIRGFREMGIQRALRTTCRSMSTGPGTIAPLHATRATSGTLIFLGIPVAITTALGFWQIKRLSMKQKTIKARTEQIQQSPWQSVPNELRPEEEYRPVEIGGHFITDREIRFGPRTQPKALPTRLIPKVGSVGVYHFTPFQLDDGRSILVNRGWSPAYAENNLPVDDPPQNRCEIRGVLRLPEKKKMGTPENNPSEQQWFWVDVHAIKKELDLQGPNCFVEILPTEDTRQKQPKLPFPKGLEDHLNFYVDPVTHVVYAVTWFTLAIYMSYFIYRRIYKRSSFTSKLSLLPSARVK